MPPTPPERSKAVYIERREILLGAPDAEIAEGRPKVYRAQTIKISGQHRAAETDIWLVADKLIAENAHVDVSGRLGQPSYPTTQQAKIGGRPGEAGRDADQSGLPQPGRGGNGGNITIICQELIGRLTLTTNGGRGGDGLNGGNGAQGEKGAPGKQRTTDRDEANGSPGLKGGVAGAGGIAGDGGDAGQLWLAIGKQDAGRLICAADGGQPGTPGHAGQPGEGGEGGMKEPMDYHERSEPHGGRGL